MNSQPPKSLLLSIRPNHANKILDGSKTVELRRLFPRTFENGSVLIYVSSPVKAIVGMFTINEIVEDTIEALWTSANGRSGISESEFYKYYAGAERGFAIFIKDVTAFSTAITLEKIRTSNLPFEPPQNYRYLTPNHIQHLEIESMNGSRELS